MATVANRNIIIVGRGPASVRMTYDAVQRKTKKTEFTGIVDERVLGSTRINALTVVVATLEQIKALKEAGGMDADTTPTQIITLGMVVDMISDGTFKYWLKNGGKKSDGSDVHPKELEAWQAFSVLYAELFNDVTFKNVADLKLPRNPRFAISNDQRLLAEYAEKAWDAVKIAVPEIEECEGDSL